MSEKVTIMVKAAQVRLYSYLSALTYLGDISVKEKGFVQFKIHSNVEGVGVRDTLLIFDHRPATIEKAKAVDSEASLDKRSAALRELVDIINQPANVAVRAMKTRQTNGHKKLIYFINLFPSEKKCPSVLLSKTRYATTREASWNINSTQALWRWKSSSYNNERTYGHTVLVALTDDAHKVIAEGRTDFQNGWKRRVVKTIGSNISSQMEEYPPATN